MMGFVHHFNRKVICHEVILDIRCPNHRTFISVRSLTVDLKKLKRQKSNVVIQLMMSQRTYFFWFIIVFFHALFVFHFHFFRISFSFLECKTIVLI